MFSTSHKNGMGSNAYTNTPSSMVGELYASVGGGAPWRHIFRGVVDPTNVTMRYGDRADRAFQGFGTCITAEYTIQGDNNVSVFNREIRKDGTVDSIEGYAFYDTNCTGGELTVYLEGTPSNAPYWVLELGPVVNDEYDYAIVSDDKQFTLFILVRNVADFFELYNDNVTATLKEMGFNKSINEPELILQDTTCVYEDDDEDKN